MPLELEHWVGMEGTVMVGVGGAQGEGDWVCDPAPGVTVTVGTEGGDRLLLPEAVPLVH